MNICGASSTGQCVYAIISGNKLMELGERRLQGCEEGQTGIETLVLMFLVVFYSWAREKKRRLWSHTSPRND